MATQVSIWYAIAAITLGAKPLSEKVSRTAFFLYILFLQLASAHHLLVEPGLSAEWRVFNTSYALYLAVLGSMIHGMTLPGAMEAAQRKNGYVNGMTYLVLPLIFQREVIWPKLAKIQPYLFGIGAAGISLFMMGAGTLGVSRRHWDITFSDATVSFDYPATAFLMMGLNGIFAIVASVGGALYVLITVGTVLFGKKVDASNIVSALGPMPQKQVSSAVKEYGSANTWNLPGTYILISVFFVTFVLYYFVNWKYLSEIWPLS